MKQLFKNITTLAILSIATLVFASQASAKDYPNIVVSIKPFYNLCAVVMSSVGKPILLLKDNASPHDYQLKPSEVELINKADLVIWGGSGIDGYLAKVVRNVPVARTMDLAVLPKLRLLPLRTSTTWHSHEDGHHHDHSNYDGHYWLDPDNAIVITQAIAQRLAEIDPVHAAVYKQNAQQFKIALMKQVKQWRSELVVAQDTPYIVFHDAYQYFNAYFKLDGVGAISLNPEIPPSAQRIAQIQDLLQQEQVECIFREPQFNYKIIDTLTNGLKVYRGVLDPLGQDVDAGTDGYFKLLENMVNSFVACGNKH